MKKIANSRETLVEEELQGFAAAFKEKVKLVPNTQILLRNPPKEKGKVKFIIGNGAGHEPAVIGWVGKGMFDVNIVGEVFTAPSAVKMLEAIEYIDDGSPILLAVQNHAGDVMNSGMAYDMAKEKGIDIHSVLFYDDIASAPKGMECERRGIGGMIFYTKIVGAFLEEGGKIEDAITLFERVRDNTRTYAVAITNCTHPVTGLSMFDMAEDEIEMGMGVHGEGGTNRRKMISSKDMARLMCDEIINDLPYKEGDEILILVNGAGSTTMMEMCILYKDIDDYLKSKGIKTYKVKVGTFLTTQELSGISLSFCKVDDTMKRLWDAPSDAPSFEQA